MLVVFACIILTNHLPNHVKVVDSLNSEHSDSDCVWMVTIENPRHHIPLNMKGCICHFTKWQIHHFIPKGRNTIRIKFINIRFQLSLTFIIVFR